jgi:MYXO-CTERM domain-containing protein
VTGAFVVNVNPGAGCHNYWFLVTGHDGQRYAYPSTGSYQMGSGCSGDYLPDRSPADCEGVIPECRIGETRACYSGPAGTQDVGVCRSGLEACNEGVFTGICENEVLPSPEVCDDRLDNDCDGEVDDGCQNLPDGGVPDTGADGETDATDPKTTGDNGCACRTGQPGGPLPGSGFLLALGMFLVMRRRLVCRTPSQPGSRR